MMSFPVRHLSRARWACVGHPSRQAGTVATAARNGAGGRPC
jgi:hypothetical protein